MNGYQIAIICLSASGLGISLVKHGEDRGEYNFWVQLIGTGIVYWLYIKAGLFN